MLKIDGLCGNLGRDVAPDFTVLEKMNYKFGKLFNYIQPRQNKLLLLNP